MKKLFLTLILILIFSTTAFAAPFLVCDPQAGVISYNLDIDGLITSDILAQPDGSIHYDLVGMAIGVHVFKAQAVGQGGWPSSWSDPLDTMKPGSPTGVRVFSE